jgi:2-keto-4-pentenoate hydratase
MGEQRRAEREMGGSVGVMTTPSERAAALYAAFRGRAPISPFTDDEPDMSVADAYAVQQSYVDLLLEGTGGRVVGYKLGLTSEPMQQMMGVHEPDYGPVLSHMVFDDGSAVDLSSYIQPRVEAEIALVLNRELRGPGITALEAGRAVEGAVAAIEMVDSRIVDWKIKLADTISDLASSAATILGSRLVPIEGWDPRLVGMVVRHNGEVVDTGAGAAALGNPLKAVAWLANTLAPFDVALQPGWFIMTGSLHRAFPVEPGDVVRADFDRLGPVSVRFE